MQQSDKEAPSSNPNQIVERDTYPDQYTIKDGDMDVIINLAIPDGIKGTTAYEQLARLKRNRELLWHSLGYGSLVLSYPIVTRTMPLAHNKNGQSFYFFNGTRFHEHHAIFLTALMELRSIGSILGGNRNCIIDQAYSHSQREIISSYFESRREAYGYITRLFNSLTFNINPVTDALTSKSFGVEYATPKILSHPPMAIKHIKQNTKYEKDSFDLLPIISNTKSLVKSADKLLLPFNQEQSFIRKSNANKSKIINTFAPNGKLPRKLLLLSAQSQGSATLDHWLTIKWIYLLGEILKRDYKKQYLGLIVSKSTFGEIRPFDANRYGFEVSQSQVFSNAIYVFIFDSQLQDEISKKNLLTSDLRQYLTEMSMKNRSAQKNLELFNSGITEVRTRALTFANRGHVTKVDLHSAADQKFIDDLATLMTIERRLIHPHIPATTLNQGATSNRHASRWTFRIDI